MPLHHPPTFIHTKTSALTFPSKPAATIPPSPIFRYEKELNEIEPLSDLARKLLSQEEGFLDLFLEVRMLYPTYEDAYEMLEEQVERITGARMYSEYHSFRRGFLRWKTKKRSPE